MPKLRAKRKEFKDPGELELPLKECNYSKADSH